MRRILTAIGSALALALAAPGVALAHHDHGRGHHKGHHAKGARVYGSPSAIMGTEDIGTVSSIEGEVLTIKLNDGSSVSGTLTKDTHVICLSAAPVEGADENGEGNDGSDEGWHHGDHGWQHGERGWQDGNCCGYCCNEEQEKALVAGATVKEAELRFTPAGASWESVVLVQ